MRFEQIQQLLREPLDASPRVSVGSRTGCLISLSGRLEGAFCRLYAPPRQFDGVTGGSDLEIALVADE